MTCTADLADIIAPPAGSRMRRRDFIFGTGTSSYQIGGAAKDDGRLQPIWDTFCARAGKVLRGENGNVACDHYRRWAEEVGPLAELGVAAYLRDVALELGALRIEGTIVEVERRPEDGCVAALRLADGRRIDGELFIDCLGQRGLLIEGTMQAGYDDWSAMLPCDSALAVPCARVEPLTPYTVSAAKDAGWTWRIPLQHRTGNGHVCSSGFSSDEAAARTLLQGLDGKVLDTPRPIRFTTGRRRQSWVKNVVAIGLSAGFLEPLESTSIHLILDNVGRLIHFFPDRDFRPELSAEFNRLARVQFEAIRDFIGLHYKLTQRSDSGLWRYCAAMPIPDTLAAQIELFRSSGRVLVRDPNGFQEPSWVSIFFGLGLRPERYDPFVDAVDEPPLHTHFARLRRAIAQTASAMPQHGDFLARSVL